MINAQKLKSMRPLLDRLGTTQWTRSVPLGDTTIGDAYDGQIRFKLTGSGPYPERRFLPDSPAAHDLVLADRDKRLPKLFHGFLESFAGRESENALHGLIFNTSPEQFGLHIATNIMHEYMLGNPGGLQIGDSPENSNLKDFKGALKLGGLMAKTSSAMRQDYLGFGPRYSSYLKELVTDGLDDPNDSEKASSLTSVLLHEMEHNTTPFGWYEYFNEKHITKGLGELSEMSPVRLLGLFKPEYWLEEALVDLLAEWGTRTSQAGVKMGLPNASAEHLPPHKYNRIVTPLRQMLEMAGFDSQDDGQFSEVERLLQEGELRDTPRKLAEAIVEHQKMDEKYTDKLTEKIQKAGKWFQLSGIPAKFRTWQIKRFVNCHSGSASA